MNPLLVFRGRLKDVVNNSNFGGSSEPDLWRVGRVLPTKYPFLAPRSIMSWFLN